MRQRLPLQLCALFLLAGCGASSSQSVSVSEGTLTDDRYTNAVVGWSMPIPPGWRVMSADDVAAMTGKGRKILEDAVGEPIEEKQTDLLYLRGSQQSAFTSARQPYDPADGTYADLQKGLFDMIADAYPKSGIPIRVEHRQETIDGVEFAVMFVSMRARVGDTEVAQQLVYDALIGTHGLTVSIVAANAAEREAALRAWRASTFRIKNGGH